MRPFPTPALERHRCRVGDYATKTGDNYGAFLVPGPCGNDLKIIVSNGCEELNDYWEHVSVSCRNRIPNWTEMCYVKDLFWELEEAVMQLHPPRSTWVNNHAYVLHLWRPLKENIPLPPPDAVGVPGVTGLERTKW